MRNNMETEQSMTMKNMQIEPIVKTIFSPEISFFSFKKYS